MRLPGGAEKPPATPVTGAQPPAAKAATQAPPVTQAAPGGAAAAPQAKVQAPAAQQTAPAAPQRAEVPRLSTHIIRVEFVPVSTLIEPIKLFMTEGGVIMPYERLNMLIVTDYSDSITKIIDIIRLLDSSYLDAELIDLVEIKYNASADVLEDLKKIFGSGKDTATGIYLVSLDRINTIMVMANSQRAMEEVKRWIGRLDSTTGRSVQTFIYTVENATASNIAMVLSLLFGGDGGGEGISPSGGAGAGGVYGGAGGTSTAPGITSPMGTTGRSSAAGRSMSSMGMSQGGFGGGGGGMYGGQSYGGQSSGYGGQNVYGMGAGVGGDTSAGPGSTRARECPPSG